MKKCVCGNEMTPRDWSHEWVCKRCGRKRPIETRMTNGDMIRAMTDYDLMEFLWKLDNQDLGNLIKFCGTTHVCDELDEDEITEGMCKRCLLATLQSPAESPDGQKG